LIWTGVNFGAYTKGGIVDATGITNLVIWKKGGIEAKTLLHCDLLGDPANYYRGAYDFLSSEGSIEMVIGTIVRIDATHASGTEGNYYKALQYISSTNLSTTSLFNDPSYWQDLGTDREDSWLLEGNNLAATPLLVGENGEDYIFDGSTITFKMSRKVKEHVLTLRSVDQGNSWAVTSTLDGIGGTGNSVTTTQAVGYMALVFYTTEAFAFEPAVVPTQVPRSIGNVYCWNEHDINHEGRLTSNFINKVASGTSMQAGGLFPLTSIGATGLGYHASWNAQLPPKHGDLFDLPALNSPTVKYVDWLFERNGKAVLGVLFKEMIFDTTWGDNQVFDAVEYTSTTSDDNGNVVIIGYAEVELDAFIGDDE
jgi:hypothetical protein